MAVIITASAYKSPIHIHFWHCFCACVCRSRDALFLDNRRDFTQMGQMDFKPLIVSVCNK